MVSIGFDHFQNLKTNQIGFYEVLKKDHFAHVVKMNTPHLDKTRYGYVVFSQSNVIFQFNSPVAAVRGVT